MEDSGIDSDPKSSITISRTNNENILLTSDSSASSNHQTQQDRQRRSATKQLQRKLEARIEQAKRTQRHNVDYIKIGNSSSKANTILTKSSSLIPIQRLPIPHHNEHYPLVEYWQSDTTESEDETTLFPLSRNKQDHCGNHKQDLTDTFSIQESSEGSEASLNLIGPTTHYSSHNHPRTGCFNCSCHIL